MSEFMGVLHHKFDVYVMSRGRYLGWYLLQGSHLSHTTLLHKTHRPLLTTYTTMKTIEKKSNETVDASTATDSNPYPRQLLLATTSGDALLCE